MLKQSQILFSAGSQQEFSWYLHAEAQHQQNSFLISCTAQQQAFPSQDVFLSGEQCILLHSSSLRSNRQWLEAQDQWWKVQKEILLLLKSRLVFQGCQTLGKVWLLRFQLEFSSQWWTWTHLQVVEGIFKVRLVKDLHWNRYDYHQHNIHHLDYC